MLSTNFLIKNDTKEILIFKLNKSSKGIKYSCYKLTTKVSKKELKYINKEKSIR